MLIADDDPRSRAMLRALIELEPLLEVAGEADGVEEAIRLAAATVPDVAILDVKMPAGGGPVAARGIKAISPGTRMLAFSGSEERGALVEMLRAGVLGYVVKGTPTAEIIESIYRTARGHSVVSGRATEGAVEELIGRLTREEEEAARRREMRARIRRFIDDQTIEIVYQPIFDLRAGSLIGLEALSRFPSSPPRPPNEWFAEAWDLGLGAELELAALRLAVEEAAREPPDGYLSVNVSPKTLLSDLFLPAWESLPHHRLVLEITEHAPIPDYEEFQQPISVVRAGGGRLAVDDAGAGFASLRHILELGPDLIKLDVTLAHGIDVDAQRQAIAAGLISFGKQSGAELVAEGIESRAEMETLRSLGVRYGQGFYLARPAPLAEAMATRGIQSSDLD